jgi:hypothetical protein
LLPSDFFQLLDAWRAKTGRYAGCAESGVKPFEITYAMFSSMGNGATFALETLIFAAACVAVGSKDYQVYGDDIVIEAELVAPLLKLLRFFGLTPNLDKTHVTGPYRESCGANSWEGVDITPFYVREIPVRRTGQCHLANGLARIGIPGGHLWRKVRGYVAMHHLPIGPVQENTTAYVHIDVPTAYKSKLIQFRDGGLQVKSLREVASDRPRWMRRRIGPSAVFLWHLKRWQEQPRLESWWQFFRFTNPLTWAKMTTVSGSDSTPIGAVKVSAGWTYWEPWEAPGTGVNALTHLHMWSESLSVYIQKTRKVR